MNLLSECREGLRISWDALRANKLRSALTTLGIVIGIVTVTLMATAIEGLNRSFLRSISTIGADVLYVDRFDWFAGSHAAWMRMQKRPPITLEQAVAVERQAGFARAVAPATEAQLPVHYKNRRADSVTVIGTTDQYLLTAGLSVAHGRFLSAAEAAGGRPVCVIGAQVATNLFRQDPPLGERISVGGHTFAVVGVLERQGSFLGTFSLDNQVILPLSAFTTWFFDRPDLQIQVKARELVQLEDAREELRHLMRRIRRLAPGEPDDFAINQQDQFVRLFQTVGGTIAAVGLFVTGLSLFVGGIGIMNIMFVSVAERTHEIGIRKALGAKRRTILLQFLIEAASLCGLGGGLGLAIAWPMTLLLRTLLPARLSLPVVGLALLVALLTGLLAGFFPAWRAARLNPVDALRAE